MRTRTVLITGASRGIGAAVAVAFGKTGAHVVLVGRTVGGLEETDDRVRAAGGMATILPLDLEEGSSVDRLGPVLAERFGGLDVFIGNAGVLGTLAPIAHTTEKDWAQVMAVNVSANFRLIRSLDPLLRAAPAGRAVFVSTGQGVVQGRAYWGAYGASKAALESLVRCYAAETATTSLRVNIIDPGAVRTAMRAKAKPGEDPETLPQPEDVTSLFLSLAAVDCPHHGGVFRVEDVLPSLRG